MIVSALILVMVLVKLSPAWNGISSPTCELFDSYHSAGLHCDEHADLETPQDMLYIDKVMGVWSAYA